jgi:tight adherence protein B
VTSIPRRARSRRAGRPDRSLPSVATAVARAVRGGAPLAHACGEAGRASAEPGSQLAADLVEIERSVQRGRGLDEALEGWRRHRDDPEVDLFVAACRFGHLHGGDLAAALDGAAVSLLDRVEVADEARALSAQARSSASVLVALPLIGAAGFAALDVEFARTMLTTTPGLLCTVTGLALDAVGAMVLSRMVRAALA